MTLIDWSMLIVAGAAGLGGLGVLYRAWKRPGQPAVLSAGWALLAGAIVLAFLSNGDRGVAQASVVVMAGATALFAVPMLRGIAAPVPNERQRAQRVSLSRRSRPLLEGLSGFWTFIVAGPVAGLIALLAAAGLFKLLRPAEGSPATAGAISIIAAVLIWAVVSVLLLIEPRVGRRSAYAGLALAATAAAAFI